MSSKTLIVISVIMAALHPAIASADSGASHLYLHGLMYSGTKQNSLRGSTGFGIGFTSAIGDAAIKPILGAELTYASAIAYIDDEDYAATVYSADLLVGLEIIPLRSARIRPVVQVIGLGGIKFAQFANSDEITNNPSTSLSSGYKLNVGGEIDFGGFIMRGFAGYVVNAASKLGPKSNFNLGGFGLSLGIVF